MNNFDNLPKNRVNIIVDGEGLCWNATLFAHKKFPEVDSTEERFRTILWCVLERIQRASAKFNTNKFIFAWDSPDNKGKRKAIFPGYKLKREKLRTMVIEPTDTELIAKKKRRALENLKKTAEARPFWTTLREEILPAMGFNNQLMVDGYEGDDIIAYITQHAGKTPMVIYSEDSDLYQLITPTVCQLSVRVRRLRKDGGTFEPSVLDRRKFITTFGITPDKWAEFKAIAGCASDSVPGVSGVGKSSALRYLIEGRLVRKNGTLSTRHIAIQQAKEDGSLALWRKLVTIPFEGFPGVELKPTIPTKQGFIKICTKYNLPHVMDSPFWEEFFD